MTKESRRQRRKRVRAERLIREDIKVLAQVSVDLAKNQEGLFTSENPVYTTSKPFNWRGFLKLFESEPSRSCDYIPMGEKTRKAWDDFIKDWMEKNSIKIKE